MERHGMYLKFAALTSELNLEDHRASANFLWHLALCEPTEAIRSFVVQCICQMMQLECPKQCLTVEASEYHVHNFVVSLALNCTENIKLEPKDSNQQFLFILIMVRADPRLILHFINEAEPIKELNQNLILLCIALLFKEHAALGDCDQAKTHELSIAMYLDVFYGAIAKADAKDSIEGSGLVVNADVNPYQIVSEDTIVETLPGPDSWDRNEFKRDWPCRGR